VRFVELTVTDLDRVSVAVGDLLRETETVGLLVPGWLVATPLGVRDPDGLFVHGRVVAMELGVRDPDGLFVHGRVVAIALIDSVIVTDFV
jgi:hypothetical protein